MTKKILLTGATDGIGRETAKKLATADHHLLLHGRTAAKLEALQEELAPSAAKVETYLADLSKLDAVEKLAGAVAENHDELDVLINNAGVFVTTKPVTPDGLDVRFAVNTLAPYLLTLKLMPLLGPSARVVNLSSAAQAPVDLEALRGDHHDLSDQAAYAQSKLALTAWSRILAEKVGSDGPLVVSVNPGSLLATKMVKDAFGVAGSDISVGADILCRAALSTEFEGRSGQYFDNDVQRFGSPHPAALDERHALAIVTTMEEILARRGSST
ncbi:MAG: SDR family NAD(P)-dependent oxidoreductase [Myxococcota bacterium]